MTAPANTAETYEVENLRPERQDGADLPVYSISLAGKHVAMVAPFFDGFRYSGRYYNVLWANGKVEKCDSAKAALARATGATP